MKKERYAYFGDRMCLESQVSMVSMGQTSALFRMTLHSALYLLRVDLPEPNINKTSSYVYIRARTDGNADSFLFPTPDPKECTDGTDEYS